MWAFKQYFCIVANFHWKNKRSFLIWTIHWTNIALSLYKCLLFIAKKRALYAFSRPDQTRPDHTHNRSWSNSMKFGLFSIHTKRIILDNAMKSCIEYLQNSGFSMKKTDNFVGNHWDVKYFSIFINVMSALVRCYWCGKCTTYVLFLHRIWKMMHMFIILIILILAICFDA